MRLVTIFTVVINYLNIKNAVEASCQKNDVCKQYEKLEIECYNKTIADRQARGLSTVFFEQDAMRIDFDSSAFEEIRGRYKRDADNDADAGAISSPDVCDVIDEVKRKWMDAYTKPITYMLVFDEAAESTGVVDNMAQFRSIIYAAFEVWAKRSAIRFIEVTSESIAEVKVQFYPARTLHGESPCEEFRGSTFKSSDATKDDSNVTYAAVTRELAHGNMPGSKISPGDTGKRYNGEEFFGDLHISSDIAWTYSTDPNSQAFNIFSVAIHEIGHILGLFHSNCQDSVMFPSYNAKNLAKYSAGSSKLPEIDDLAIRCLYGEKGSWISQKENYLFLSIFLGWIGFLLIYQIISGYVVTEEYKNAWKTYARKQVKTLAKSMRGKSKKVDADGDTEAQTAEDETPPTAGMSKFQARLAERNKKKGSISKEKTKRERPQKKMKKQDSVMDDMIGGGFGGEDDDFGGSSGGRGKVTFGGLDPVGDNEDEFEF